MDTRQNWGLNWSLVCLWAVVTYVVEFGGLIPMLGMVWEGSSKTPVLLAIWLAKILMLPTSCMILFTYWFKSLVVVVWCSTLISPALVSTSSKSRLISSKWFIPWVILMFTNVPIRGDFSWLLWPALVMRTLGFLLTPFCVFHFQQLTRKAEVHMELSSDNVDLQCDEPHLA
jgi:hypothetical protein